MPLTFFADHCISNSTVAALESKGHTTLRLRDHLPVESPDQKVIAKTQELDAILITLNGDFADIVTYPPKYFGGIVALQLRNRPESLPILLRRLLEWLNEHPDREYYRGKLLLIDQTRIRIRE